MLIEIAVSPKDGIAVIMCVIVLALFVYKAHVLDVKGSILASLMGLIIGIFGSPAWFLILLLFLFSSFVATRFMYEFKQKMGTAEPSLGMRRSSNVFYNGIAPTIIALFSAGIGEGASWLFITAIAAAASDTFASEVGVLSNRVYMITNPSRNSITSNPAMRIRPGVDGGVSLLGTVAAFFAAFTMAFIGWLVIPYYTDLPPTLPMLILPALIGFIGCNIDSLLGATLESWGILNKGQVNLTEITIATLIMWLFI